MANSTLQKITNKARSIRHKGEPWIHAVKRASKLVMSSLSPSKKAARKKTARKKVGATKKRSNRQTGTSNRSIDKRIKAKAPGKRTVKHRGGKSTVYYERRKNRSDKPGQLTGVTESSQYRYNVLQRVNNSVRLLAEAEARLERMKKLLKQADRPTKNRIRSSIKDQQKYISTLKKDVRGFKALIK